VPGVDAHWLSLALVALAAHRELLAHVAGALVLVAVAYGAAAIRHACALELAVAAGDGGGWVQWVLWAQAPWPSQADVHRDHARAQVMMGHASRCDQRMYVAEASHALLDYSVLCRHAYR